MNARINSNQMFALNKLVDSYTDGEMKARRFVVSALIGRDVIDSGDVLVKEWQRIRDEAYPHWQEQDWRVDRKFGAKVARIVEEWREQVLGQGRLF